ncbi:M13 family metallopeptidase [Georgenia sp. Z1491]|uniref:M13 family metallopeptidase n=1 Tax=Georgenia sp. Z1491 TaxID=3416707 RepID=UPI003CFA9CF9
MTSSTTETPVDLESYVDTDVRPQDDLFRHVNGRWIAETEIPADRARIGGFIDLRDRSEERVRALIEELGAAAAADGDPEGVAQHAADPAVTDADPAGAAPKIGAVYAMFMDESAIEAAGAEPLAADLDLVRGADDHASLARVMGELQRTGVSGLAGIDVSPGISDPDYLVWFAQDGIGLPDEAYYREAEHAAVREAYAGHVGRLLELVGAVGAGEGAGAAERVLALETRIASSHWDVVATREADKIDNPMSFDELAASAPGLDWTAYRAGLRLPDGDLKLLVATPSALVGAAETWASTPVDDLRVWLSFHAAASRAPFLTKEIVAERFDFAGRTLTGAQENRERWRRGVGLVEGLLGEDVGRLYVARHFPPAHKARMDELVANLVEAYRVSIDELDWMSAGTKERAQAKLAAFTPKIGFPEVVRDSSGLVVTEGDLVGSVRAGRAYWWDDEMARYGTAVDRREWLMTPQTVNAYYNPVWNEIVFPAAILQPPFFDPETDDAFNYGGIGTVIGHEIGHGFDDQGSKFGPDGQLSNWWTEEDRERFMERANALIAQYDGLVPAQLGEGSEASVNGALTVGENIGDLGGLDIGLKAYALALRAQGIDSIDDAPVLDGRSGLQRFFTGWARVWRSKHRDETLRTQMATDPHSPDEFRANVTASNLDAFHRAFDVQPGDGGYRAPEDRVAIW